MKSFFSLIITLTLFTILTPLTHLTQLPAAKAAGTVPFVDVHTDHEYLPSIQYLKANEIVEGYEVEAQEERQFRPDYQLNRAELTKIMIEAQFTEEEIDACILHPSVKDVLLFQQVAKSLRLDLDARHFFSGQSCRRRIHAVDL